MANPFDQFDKSEANPFDRFDAPVAVKAGSALNDIPRQLGLTARYGLEGLANSLQIVTEPIRYLQDKLTPDREVNLSDVVAGKARPPKSLPLGAVASNFADYIGLPQPQGANERVIGDATRLVAGAGGMAGAASKLGGAASDLLQFGGKEIAPFVQGAAQKVWQALAPNPTQQLTSAAGAGLAGGASRESGGNDWMQAGAALVGGVLGGKATDIVSSGGDLLKRLTNMRMTPQEYDVKISNVLKQSGVDYSQIPERARQSLRAELAGALQADKELDPAAVSRLLAFKETGVTPTRGMVSQNPVQITREMNLAKMGANSSDEGLQGLALMQNQNNAKLVSNLNDLGANRGNALNAGERVTSSVLGTQAGLRGTEQAAWNEAKGSPGYKQPISSKVLSDINGALGDEGLMPFMNPTISKYMEAFQTGQPFTPQAYKNLQSMLSNESAKGGNEAAAAGLAARILRNTDMAPAGFVNTGNLPATQGMAAGMRAADGSANDAIDAVNAARRATRAAYEYEGSSPLVRSVLSDSATSDPQRIAQRFVIGGTANEAADLVNQVGPQGLGTIKDAVLNHLKSKAVNGASDEVAKFSQSAFNKALNDIGERKMALLFAPEEIRALQTNGRVASLMQSQPVGSAVNNSNSGALLLGRGGDMLSGLAGKLPGGKAFFADPMQNIAIAIRQRQAQNLMPGLLAQQPESQLGQSMLLPGLAFGGGLLSAP